MCLMQEAERQMKIHVSVHQVCYQHNSHMRPNKKQNMSTVARAQCILASKFAHSFFFF